MLFQNTKYWIKLGKIKSIFLKFEGILFFFGGRGGRYEKTCAGNLGKQRGSFLHLFQRLKNYGTITFQIQVSCIFIDYLHLCKKSIKGLCVKSNHPKQGIESSCLFKSNSNPKGARKKRLFLSPNIKVHSYVDP